MNAFDIVLHALRVELGTEKESEQGSFPPAERSGRSAETEQDPYGQVAVNRIGKRAEAAGKLLQGLGFRCQIRSQVEDVYMKPPYLNIEIHRKLFSEDDQPKESSYFGHIWDMAEEASPHLYKYVLPAFYLWRS